MAKFTSEKYRITIELVCGAIYQYKGSFYICGIKTPSRKKYFLKQIPEDIATLPTSADYPYHHCKYVPDKDPALCSWFDSYVVQTKENK